jgi:hypothetical protein|tara:strand:- start:557 stop:1045 length:489 start_codon:yes stop_codon:yes gene_type:complete
MLYSIKGEYPIDSLPHRIRLSDGSTRTDSSTFTADELSSAGITTVSYPPEYNADTHKLIWDNTDVEWEVVALTQEEIDNLISIGWQGIRNERDSLLKKTDEKILRYQSEVRIGITTTTDNISDLDAYAQVLRDIPSTYSNPNDVEWPNTPWESEGVDSTEKS